MSQTTIQTIGLTDSAVTISKINFANALVPIGGIIMWSGTIANIPTGWALCDGITSGTPDLRNKFIVGAHSGAGTGTVETAGPGFDTGNGTLNSNYTPGNTGGETAHQLSIPELASHSHGLTNIIGDGGGITVGSSGHLMNNNGGKTTDATGDGKFHENRPPYYALAFIMRTV